MKNKAKRFGLMSAMGLLPLITVHLVQGQVAPYTKAATLVGGNWPSINNKGAMVWSQLDNLGYWQVWMQDSPFSSVATQVTSGNQNHERPGIDDNDDIIYFQDNSGQGAGYEVILVKNGIQSVLEFSSANPTSCIPPNAGCISWHTAGKNFGIAANGTTITYYDFCTAGNPPLCKRRFNVSGIGTLQCSGSPCDFVGYDYPTINSNGQIAFSDSANPPNLFYTTTASPQAPFNSLGNGEIPHLADAVAFGGQLNPQVVFEQNATVESNLLLNNPGQEVPVDSGVWANVNNSGAIVYQRDSSNTSPIWFAGNANAIDLSDVPQISWNEILTQYAPRLVIADAWGGFCKQGVTPCQSSFDPKDILSGALIANQNLAVAAYAVLNLNSTLTPAQQMGLAVKAVGPSLKPLLKFMAIDLEPGLFNSSKQVQNVAAIVSAIQTLENQYHLKPVIYAGSNTWQSATGNDPTIGGCGTGQYCVPIWNPRSDRFPDLFDDRGSTGSIAPWVPVGGWSVRSGKQHNIGQCYKTSQGGWSCPGVQVCNPRFNPNCPCMPPTISCKNAGLLDLDVIDTSLFQ